VRTLWPRERGSSAAWRVSYASDRHRAGAIGKITIADPTLQFADMDQQLPVSEGAA